MSFDLGFDFGILVLPLLESIQDPRCLGLPGTLTRARVILGSLRIGVTRNLYCDPDALQNVQPPFDGQLMPANISLVERKWPDQDMLLSLLLALEASRPFRVEALVVLRRDRGICSFSLRSWWMYTTRHRNTLVIFMKLDSAPDHVCRDQCFLRHAFSNILAVPIASVVRSLPRNSHKDINLFVIMRFGFSDAQGRIWFEARQKHLPGLILYMGGYQNYGLFMVPQYIAARSI